MDDYLSKPLVPALLFSKLSDLALALMGRAGDTAAGGGAPGAAPASGDAVAAFDTAPMDNLALIMTQDDLHGVIDLFLDDVGKRIARIGAAAAQKDLAATGQEAHAIRGSADNVGALRLGHLASALEAACRDGEHDNAERIADALPAAAVSASDALCAWRDARLHAAAVTSPVADAAMTSGQPANRSGPSS